MSAATKQTKADIARLKEEYVDYYRQVPVQRYAAMAIGRSEDTIIAWRKEDEDFSEQVEKAHAEWVRKKAAETRAEFALERLEKDIWSSRTEHTGKDGGPIETKAVEVMDVGGDDEQAQE
jgi:hypothetical protein